MPKKKIFQPVRKEGDWRRNAIVSRRDDHALAIGFAATADLIVEDWVNGHPNDLLFEPLVYVHRHALELVLKAAIREAAARLREEAEPGPEIATSAVEDWLTHEAGHNLHKLVNRLDNLLRRLDEEELPPDTHRALLSIHELDPSGQTFRYAKVKRGDVLVDAPRPLLDSPDVLQAHVDVVAMHEHFRAAFSLLSGGVMTVLENIAEFQRDMAQEADW